MTKQPIYLFSFLLLATGCTAPQGEAPGQSGGATGSGAIMPQPIPAGFDFPALREEVQKWADDNDIIQIRTHAWNVWAGMTTNSKSIHNGQVLPIWETWCGDEEVFSTTPCGPRAKPFRRVRSPKQIDHTIPASATQVVSFNPPFTI